MIWLFYISALIIFISLIIGLIRYEKSGYYKSLHFNSRSDIMKNKYVPNEEKRIEIDKLIKKADDFYEKYKNK